MDSSYFDLFITFGLPVVDFAEGYDDGLPLVSLFMIFIFSIMVALQYSVKVTQSYIYIYIYIYIFFFPPFFSPIIFHNNCLGIVLCSVQQDLTAYPLQESGVNRCKPLPFIFHVLKWTVR